MAFIDGEQMRNVMKEVNEEIQKNLNESFVTNPLCKKLHLKLKETAINYEISLELKSKQLDEIKSGKV